MGNQLIVTNSFEIYVPFYLTVDRNKCISFVKFEFCFLERLGYHAEQA